MNTKSDLKFYRERQELVEEIEQIGFTNYNALARLMIRLGIKSDKHVEKMQINLP